MLFIAASVVCHLRTRRQLSCSESQLFINHISETMAETVKKGSEVLQSGDVQKEADAPASHKSRKSPSAPVAAKAKRAKFNPSQHFTLVMSGGVLSQDAVEEEKSDSVAGLHAEASKPMVGCSVSCFRRSLFRCNIMHN